MPCFSFSKAVVEDSIIELFAADFLRQPEWSSSKLRTYTCTYDGWSLVDSLKDQIHYFKFQSILSTQEEFERGKAQKWHPKYRTSSRIFRVC